MTHETTTLTIYTVPTTERIRRAYARHQNATRGTWYASAPQEDATSRILPTAAEMTAEQLLTLGDIATGLQLRARDAKTGVKLFADLRATAGLDRRNRRQAEHGTDETYWRTLHEEHTRAKDYHAAQAKRLTITAEERAEHDAARAYHKSQADAALIKATTIMNEVIADTMSDREDIAQDARAAAIAAASGNPIHNAARGAKDGISKLAHPDALNSARTDVKPITDEDAAALIDRYGAGEKIPHKSGYQTVEYRDSKQYKKGWYLITHRRTIRAAIAYDAMDDSGASIGVQWNGGINAITGQTDAEELEELFDRANLTARERDICRKLADNTAAMAGARAIDAYRRETAEHAATITNEETRRKWYRRRTAGEEQERRAAALDNAMSRAGVTAGATQRKTLSRLRAALEKAQTTPEPQTDAERAAANRRQWERLQANRYNHIATARAAERADLIAAVTRAAAAINTGADAITWTQATTPDASAQDATRAARAAEETRRHWIDATRAALDAHKTPSAYAAMDAADAARVFLDAMTAAQIRAAARAAEKAAERDRTAAPKKAAPTDAERAAAHRKDLEDAREIRRYIAENAAKAERANPYRIKHAARVALVFWDAMTAAEHIAHVHTDNAERAARLSRRR